MAGAITQADLDQSYRMLSFLRLCETAAADLAGGSVGDTVARRDLYLASSLELTLQAALEIAEGLHDKLELAERQASKAEAEPCA